MNLHTFELRDGSPTAMSPDASEAMRALDGLTTPVRYIERLANGGWGVTLVTFGNPVHPYHWLRLQYTDAFIASLRTR